MRLAHPVTKIRIPPRVWRQARLSLWGPCLFSDLIAVWELSVEYIVQCVWLILSRRFSSRPEPPTCQARLSLWGPCLFSDLLAVWELSVEYIVQYVWFILSRRFASRPEPRTCLAPSQALAVRPVLIQWSVSCVGVKCRIHSTVRLAHLVTKIRLPPVTPHTSGAKPGSRFEARAYSVIC